MPVVDQLVVTLTLDPKDFQKGEAVVMRSQKRMREEAVQTDKQFQASAKSIGDALNRARNTALGLITVFTAGRGISSFVQQTTESSAALGRMSRDLQISTQNLSAWEAVSRRAGNAAGDVSGAFANINSRIQAFRLTGDASQLTGFRNLRVQTSDTQGRVRPTEDIYQDVLRALAGRDPRERASMAALAGFGQETVNLAAIPEAQRARMMVEGRPDDVTPEQVARATQLRDAWLTMERALTTIGRQILDEMTPAIIAVSRKLQEFARFLGSEEMRPVWEALREAVRQFTDYLTSPALLDDLRALGNGISSLVEKIVEALRWLGLIPRPPAAGEPAPSVAPGSPAAVYGSQTNIYEPGGAARTPGGAAASTRAGTTAAQRTAYEFLTGRGWSPAQAAGIVGHLSGESGQNLNTESFNPAGGGQGAMGIGQWRGPRIEQFRRMHGGRSPMQASLEEQLNFVDWELRNTESAAGQALRGARDPAEAADIVFRRYGRPEARDPTGAARGESAARVLREMGGPRAPAPDPAATGAPRQGASNTFGGNNTNSAEISIGAISIQTAATDAAGIARDLAPALRRSAFVEQATVGLV